MKEQTITIFDGDGDGISAAAIWLMDKPEEYLAITNKQKNQRDIVKNIFSISPEKFFQRNKVGIFDLDAKQNLEALKNIPRYFNVDFIDHHTKDSSILPTHINNLTKPDTKKNCTATISYDIAKKKGTLNSYPLLIKATQLGIIGLANDGKKEASETFGRELLGIIPPDRKLLIQYAKAINFGSATGKMDSTEILKGIVESVIPLNYLAKAEKTNELIEERKRAMDSLNNNTIIQEKEGIILYQLPSKTQWDKETSTIGYGEFMNTRMEEEPSKIHIGLIETPKGNYIFSARNKEGLAQETIDTLAKAYGKEALGRKTAAGFSTNSQVDRTNLLEKILEARE